ncbi:unnamed protein product [Brassicogethes aeneus]|uniref:Uncharacterized protein n=1 Tax=Brassicogethes aeneus TaxID=1431903 RepID=A0A9P0B956_BRAAE|nr:unnamed protein product [Brassicogethes aeneus]
MKWLIVVAFCLFSSAFAFEKNLQFDGHRDIVDRLKEELVNPKLGLLANLDKKITNSSLDPLDIPGYDQKFLGEETKLSKGKLHGLSTLHRYKDCIITYERTEDVLTVQIPIQFNDISFTYDYLIKVILIPYKGGVTGKMTNFRMNYVFSLDLNTYHVALKTSEITHSGFKKFNSLYRITMKFLVFFVACIALAKANYAELISQKYESSTFEIPQDVAEDFLVLARAAEQGLESGTSAVINNYTDRLLLNIGKFIVHSGMDPMELPELNQKLIPVGHFYLTEGWLQDTSTIGRYGDVIVSYSHDKKFSIEMPLLFDDLQLTYNYKVKVGLVSYKGEVLGKIKNLKMKAILDFDFNTYQASLKKFDMTKTGTLTLKFTGNVLVDWLVNAMSSAVSLLLHPIITRIMTNLVKLPLESVVSMVNNLINSILFPATTTLAPVLL